MSRYVIATRRTGSQARSQPAVAGRMLQGTPPVRSLTVADSASSQVAQALAAKATTPGVIVEPLVRRGHDPIDHHRFIHAPAPAHLPRTLVGAPGAPASADAAQAALPVTVAGNQGGLAGVAVTLVLEPASVSTGTTAADGTWRFTYPSTLTPSTVSTGPYQQYWSVVTATPASPASLTLPPIVLDGPLAWWHRAMGVRDDDPGRGAGIRVGIVDSGTGSNPCLAHVHVVGAIIDGQFSVAGGADCGMHGTAIAGLIAARPCQPGDFTGIAPGAETYAIRVFGPDGANQADVAAAIDMLVDVQQVDLINLSLTGTVASELERDAIQYAWEHGVLCLCAAGNDAAAIMYPAQYPEAVSVAALGVQGWGPPTSVAAQMAPAAPDQVGRDHYYLAPFSSRGTGLDCCAPGIGIISTAPATADAVCAWSEDSGTSLATPLATGALAAILGRSAAYRATPRDATRATMARALLLQSAQGIGIEVQYQGRGIPTV